MAYCSFGYELLGEIVRRVSGQSLADFCRERIFGPLSMADTHYILPNAKRHRVVRRTEGAPGTESWNTILRIMETPWAMGGVCSTALDMAIFGQMFLNRGAYGEAKVLCPASVAEMTRNQIPGIGAQYQNLVFAEASWGLGWSTRADKNSIAYAETLQSQRAFGHGGAGGTFMWVDPSYGIVGVYFSVSSQGGIPPDADLPEYFGDMELLGRPDLLINAVTATVLDA
jgi:CubicO group peptidase (beta-lactamase class C family)